MMTKISASLGKKARKIDHIFLSHCHLDHIIDIPFLIEGTKSGMLVLDPSIIRNLHPREGSTLAGMTPRQQEVLELMAQGYNNAAIAKRLGLSEKSVETYINVIYQALGLPSEQEIHARVKATLIFLRDTRSHQQNTK